MPDAPDPRTSALRSLRFAASRKVNVDDLRSDHARYLIAEGLIDADRFGWICLTELGIRLCESMEVGS